MNLKKRIIFVDSTISHEELSNYVQMDDLLLPGIKRGDLIQNLFKFPSIETVIIVDGVFEQQASVTHKEIVWVLEQGIKVIGLSSMGALRAYELRDYGMIGYGQVYQYFLEGLLEGDDEVAVSYFPLLNDIVRTIAMVNIRATFDKLGLCDNDLINKVRKIHFKKRNWPSLQASLPEDLFVQLKSQYVDQKKEDVLLFFKTKGFGQKSLRPKSSPKNIYIMKELASIYPGLIAYLECYLKRMPLISLEFKSEAIEQIASDIINYLEYNKCHTDKIIFILNELHSFNYKEDRLKLISERVRREQKLLSTSQFTNYLNQKKIPTKSLNALFEGLLKLEAYFLTNDYSLNTL